MRQTTRKYAALFAVSLMALAGCSSSSESSDGAWPQDQVDEFMKSCVISPEMEEYCQCTLDEMQKAVPFEKLKELEDSGTTPLEAMETLNLDETIQKCMPLILGGK